MKTTNIERDGERLRREVFAAYVLEKNRGSYDDIDRVLMAEIAARPVSHTPRPRFFARLTKGQNATGLDGLLSVDSACRILDSLPTYKMPSRVYHCGVWEQMVQGPKSLTALQQNLEKVLLGFKWKRLPFELVSRRIEVSKPKPQPKTKGRESPFTYLWNHFTSSYDSLFEESMIAFLSEQKLVIQNLHVLALFAHEALLTRQLDRFNFLKKQTEEIQNSPTTQATFGASHERFFRFYEQTVLDCVTATRHWSCSVSPLSDEQAKLPIGNKAIYKEYLREIEERTIQRT